MGFTESDEEGKRFGETVEQNIQEKLETESFFVVRQCECLVRGMCLPVHYFGSIRGSLSFGILNKAITRHFICLIRVTVG